MERQLAAWQRICDHYPSVMELILDAIILSCNVLTAGLLVALCGQAYLFQRLRFAVWNDRAPWLGAVMGTLHAGLTLVLGLGLYWLAYRWLGFPGWMRWIVG